MRAGGAAKENIYRRTVTVLAQITRKHRHAIFDRQMMIGRRDINTSVLVWFTIFGCNGHQITATSEDLSKIALTPNVHDDKNGSLQRFRQIFDKLTERAYTAGRRTDDDNIALWC